MCVCRLMMIVNDMMMKSENDVAACMAAAGRPRMAKTYYISVVMSLRRRDMCGENESDV